MGCVEKPCGIHFPPIVQVNSHLLDVIDYLQEENRVLKQRLGRRRIRFTNVERRRLARKAHALGRKVLREWFRITSCSSSTSLPDQCTLPVSRLTLTIAG